MTEEAVAVEGLTKVFPVPFHRKAIVAVRDLNLRVGPGEVYGLLGPNGSGKSTTLKIILGLVSPTHGRTKIFGRDSSLVESREAVGFLPENPYFYRFLTGEETLRFFGKLCRLNGSRLNDRVRELLELVGLTNARDQRLSTYSKGILALAYASPGDLRSRRNSCRWHSRPRRAARGIDRNREPERARFRKRVRRAGEGNRKARRKFQREIDRAPKIDHHSGAAISRRDPKCRSSNFE